MLSNHDREILGTAANYLEKILAVQTNNIVSAIKSLKEEPVKEEPVKEEYVKTNLNYYVKVRLNEEGFRIHREEWKPIADECRLIYTPPEKDKEGYCKFQIHDFMVTFGKYCTMGSKPFCEGLNIWIQILKV